MLNSPQGTAEERNLIEKLIVIDISPAVGPVSPEFHKYVKGMQAIEAAEVRSRKEADLILQDFESVSPCRCSTCVTARLPER